MEAGSVPGGPAAVSAAAPQPQVPAADAAAQTADAAAGGLSQAPIPQAPTPPQAQPEAGSLEAQLAAMTQRAEAAEAQIQGNPQVPTSEGEPQDLVSLLLAEEDGGLTPEEVAAQQTGQGPEAEPGGDEAALEELTNFVQEEAKKVAQSMVDPILQERQDEQLNALQGKYPDILSPEVSGKLLPTLQNLEQELGVENARLSPRLVEMAYKAVKAELADAGAAPAEQAANHGASIETQAGQTQQGDASLEQQYANALGSVSQGGSEFD